MDIRLLKQFVAVYEERNISRAAERSFVSQPALSNAIRQLEDELGCLLFHRSKRGVTPTTEAEQLYPMAMRMIGDLDSLPKLFAGEAPKSELTLAIMPELPQRYIARVLAGINELSTSTSLNLTLLDQKADARILLDVMKDEDELFLPLWREDYVFCLHRDHPLAQKQQIVLGDLHNQAFIVCPPCEGHHRTLGQLAQKNLSVNIVANAESKHQVAMLLLANAGVSFLPEGMATEWPEIVVRPFEGEPIDYRQVGLAWTSKRLPSPFLKAIIQHFKENTVDTASLNRG